MLNQILLTFLLSLLCWQIHRSFCNPISTSRTPDDSNDVSSSFSDTSDVARHHPSGGTASVDAISRLLMLGDADASGHLGASIRTIGDTVGMIQRHANRRSNDVVLSPFTRGRQRRALVVPFHEPEIVEVMPDTKALVDQYFVWRHHNGYGKPIRRWGRK